MLKLKSPFTSAPLLALALWTAPPAHADPLRVVCKPVRKSAKLAELVMTANTEGEFGPISRVTSAKLTVPAKPAVEIKGEDIYQTWSQSKRLDVYAKDMSADKLLLLVETRFVKSIGDGQERYKGNVSAPQVADGKIEVICDTEGGQ